MTRGRKQVSEKASAAYDADVALAARFDQLLGSARSAERAFRQAQAARAAYAAERAEIGPRGYDDRIFRRKAKAKPAVHAWTDEAERLLTLRETQMLTGIPPVPRSYAA